MKTAVSAIIIRNKEILLIKRGKNTKLFPGHWFVPGGKSEEWEDIQETIVREIHE